MDFVGVEVLLFGDVLCCVFGRSVYLFIILVLGGCVC